MRSRTGGLVFHAGTRRDPDGTWRTNGGRIITVVGRGANVEAAADAAHRAAAHISWTGLQRRHDIGGPPRDPALHARRDGRDLGRGGALRAHAPGRDRRRPGPGPARAGAAGRARRDRGARDDRRGPDRRDRADHRPRRHRVRQPGRRVGGAGGPVPAPRPHQQRRPRHRARAPASSGRRAICSGTSTRCCMR